MTKTDFAELKERLIRFDDKDEGAFRYYADMCSDKIMDSHKAYQEGAYYQNTKTTAIITELLDIIQSQSEAANEIKYQCARTYNTTDADEVSKLENVFPLSLVLRALSETNTRLQKK